MNKKEELSRRKFISNAAFGTAGVLGAVNMLASCSPKEKVKLPEMLDYAPDGEVLKAGLIGCGGRGTGAALDFLNSGPNLQITALGDVSLDKLNACRENLKSQKGVEIADEKCFIGFDSYEKVIDSGVDVVLLCTPQHFRPAHLEAAVNAGKHIFMEKPAAVDPVGARKALIAVKKAEQLGLCIVGGTIRRYQKDYQETYRRVANGEIGEIVSAHFIRNGVVNAQVKRRPGWSDMEYMLQNWYNFCWLSGDFIVDQFVHELDVMTWFIGKLPVQAIAWGGRQRRNTGDQYDFFSVEYVYDNGMQTHGATRQINGCDNMRRELIVGTKGIANCGGIIYDLKGNEIWKYPEPEEENKNSRWKANNPFIQEHVNLVTAIRTGNTINGGEALINSTLVAIMARMSAYTGKNVSWEEVLNSDLSLGPKTYAFGPVPGIPEVPPQIGVELIPV